MFHKCTTLAKNIFRLTLDMRLVKINGKSTHVPESWADVTLQRYTVAAKALRDHSKHHNKAIGASIAALLNINEPTLFSCDVELLDELATILNFFFTTQPQPLPVGEFTIKDTTFKVPTEIENQSFGEFVDMDTLVTDNADDYMQAVPGILAIYCRPEGEAYNPDLTPSRTAMMQTMNIELAEGMAAFFLTKGQLSRSLTAQFGSRLVSLTYKVHRLKSLPKHTGGLQRLRHWLMTICLRWIRSRIKVLGQS